MKPFRILSYVLSSYFSRFQRSSKKIDFPKMSFFRKFRNLPHLDVVNPPIKDCHWESWPHKRNFLSDPHRILYLLVRQSVRPCHGLNLRLQEVFGILVSVRFFGPCFGPIKCLEICIENIPECSRTFPINE